LKSLLHQSRLSHLAKHRNGYLALASGLLVLCLMLLFFCFHLSQAERIILVPPNIARTFWITQSEASPEYLSEMSAFFAYLRLNLTPENADSQRQLLLRYVDPRFYGPINNALILERDRITKEHISTAFYPVNIRVDAKRNTVIITGDFVSNMGLTQLSLERVSYQLHYRYDQGRLLVSQFQEVKTHE
jgi:conjugal transfer pilus assembly protein TraE